MDDVKLKTTIAQRLSAYRKLNGYTQLQIAEKINYSDKSISKWERGDGVPDIFVLATLAEIYSISVNDFLSDKSEPDKLIAVKKRLSMKSKTLISLLSVGITWLIAAIVFFALKLALPEASGTWLVFICTMPIAAIVAVVFSSIWGGLLLQFVSISGLIWSLAVTIHLCFRLQNMFWIYLVAASAWVLVILWILLRKQNYNLDKLLHRGQ